MHFDTAAHWVPRTHASRPSCLLPAFAPTSYSSMWKDNPAALFCLQVLRMLLLQAVGQAVLASCMEWPVETPGRRT